MSSEGKAVPTYNGVAFEENELALKAIPKLSDLLTDGMVRISDLKVKVPGAYEFGDYVVFAHRFYRRSGSLLNWINRDFLERLEKNRSDSLRIDRITGMPKDMEGTKSPSITSMWRIRIRSCDAMLSCSPSLLKSAERIEGHNSKG